jgi:hypothetical protein
MSRTLAARETTRDPLATARLHAIFRFATGITVALVLCEYMEWAPTFLAPIFFALLITNLPASPPLKVGIVLIVLMSATALTSFLLVTLLRNAPAILVGIIGILVFLALVALAHRRATMPAMLVLIAVATVPVIGMLDLTYAGTFAWVLAAGLAIAIVDVWCMYAIWPTPMPKTAQAAPPPIDFPIRMALAGTLIVMSLLLLYLLFGWVDVIPVLTSTLLIVIHLEPDEGGRQAMYRSVSVLFGGLIGWVAFLLLAIMPTLATLALITFVIGLLFATHVDKPGAHGTIAALAFNTAMILFGKAIASPDNSSGIWIQRLFEFTIAGFFAVGMMHVLMGRRGAQTSAGPLSTDDGH